MRKIMVTQKDAIGGKDREFTYWVKPELVQQKLRAIERAFNMDHTEVTVTSA